MEYTFKDNEFTLWDLLEYLQRAYGSLTTGSAFKAYHVYKWTTMKSCKIPDAYGGNRILKIKRPKDLMQCTVYTIEGLSRSDIELTFGKLTEFTKYVNGRRLTTPEEKLQKSATGKRIFRSGQKIPVKYKMMGVKENQVKRYGGKRSTLKKKKE